MKLLVTFKENYADEFDVHGFTIVDQDKWNEYVEHLKKELSGETMHEWYFGTNEFIIFETYGDKPLFDIVMKSYNVTEIDDNIANQLKNIFEKTKIVEFPYSFGFFPWLNW
jgi:hypothetical protein